MDFSSYTVGTIVDVIRDDGSTFRSSIKYEPWEIGGGRWLVGVKGITGGYDIKRVILISEEQSKETNTGHQTRVLVTYDVIVSGPCTDPIALAHSITPGWA